MNKRDTEACIVKHLTPYFNDRGFFQKKSERTQIEFYWKGKDIIKKFTLSTINYGDSHNMRCGFGMLLKPVEEIVHKVNEKIPLMPPARKDSMTLGFGHRYIPGNWNDGAYPYMDNEEDVINNMKTVMRFSEEVGLPLLEALTDVREIDRRINGEGENFWLDDDRKPFHLQGYFYLRRRIIAKLSGRKDYEDFIDRLYAIIDENMARKGKGKFDRTDLDDDLNYCIHLLKDVKPLY